VEVATTRDGVSVPFSSECHSDVISGKRVARLFVTDTRLFAQNGQPDPRVRLFGFARQR
jgi:hypothetical protein